MNYRKKENLKILSYSFFFLAVSIVFVLSMLRFGIPLIIGFTSLLIDRRPTIDQFSQFIPPPNLYSNQNATNSAEIEILGKSLSDGVLKIFVNDSETKKFSVSSGEDFSTYITLSEGENSIYGLIQGEGEQISATSKPIIIDYGKTAPKLNVEFPQDESRFFGEKQKFVWIEGETDPESDLFINDRRSSIDAGGKFKIRFELSEGPNLIKILAQNYYGNKTEKQILVYFSF